MVFDAEKALDFFLNKAGIGQSGDAFEQGDFIAVAHDGQHFEGVVGLLVGSGSHVPFYIDLLDVFGLHAAVFVEGRFEGAVGDEQVALRDVNAGGVEQYREAVISEAYADEYVQAHKHQGYKSASRQQDDGDEKEDEGIPNQGKKEDRPDPLVHFFPGNQNFHTEGAGVELDAIRCAYGKFFVREVQCLPRVQLKDASAVGADGKAGIELEVCRSQRRLAVGAG